MIHLYRLLAAINTQREEGQDLIEYALLIVLIALALVLALSATASGISGIFSRIVATLATH